MPPGPRFQSTHVSVIPSCPPQEPLPSAAPQTQSLTWLQLANVFRLRQQILFFCFFWGGGGRRGIPCKVWRCFMQSAVLRKITVVSVSCVAPQSSPGPKSLVTPALTISFAQTQQLQSPARPFPTWDSYLFFLKKLKRFSRSFSLVSLLRSVTVPSGPLLGDTGGMLRVRDIPLLMSGGCSSAVPCGVGVQVAAALMTRIQLLISA